MNKNKKKNLKLLNGYLDSSKADTQYSYSWVQNLFHGSEIMWYLVFSHYVLESI